MFPVTPDEKMREILNDKLKRFFDSMIGLVYWYHEPLRDALEKVNQLELRNHELRKELEGALSKIEELQKPVNAPPPRAGAVTFLTGDRLKVGV